MEELQEELGFMIEPVRYTYMFDDEITIESAQNLIDVLYTYPAVDLYISTIGGEGSTMNNLIHFINKHPDITIYLTNYIASAGTFLLSDCNKEVILSEDLEFILFHLGDREVEGQFRKRKIDDKILYEQLRIMNENLIEKYTKLGLNKKEIKDIRDGNDVILYRKDFPRIKKNINKNLDINK